MADIQKPIETLFITNNSSQILKIDDIPNFPTLKPNEKIDILIYTDLNIVNNSVILRNYIKNEKIIADDYLHEHEDKSDIDHSHDGLPILTEGKNSDADRLHTHNGLVSNDNLPDSVNTIMDDEGVVRTKGEPIEDVVTLVGTPGSNTMLVTEAAVRLALNSTSGDLIEIIEDLIKQIELKQGEKGDEGEKGDIGEKGNTGEQGEKGDAGEVPTIIEAVLFGKDPNNISVPIGISGSENDEILTINMDTEELLDNIYTELIKTNIYMSVITGNNIKDSDISQS